MEEARLAFISTVIQNKKKKIKIECHPHNIIGVTNGREYDEVGTVLRAA